MHTLLQGTSFPPRPNTFSVSSSVKLVDKTQNYQWWHLQINTYTKKCRKPSSRKVNNLAYYYCWGLVNVVCFAEQPSKQRSTLILRCLKKRKNNKQTTQTNKNQNKQTERQFKRKGRPWSHLEWQPVPKFDSILKHLQTQEPEGKKDLGRNKGGRVQIGQQREKPALASTQGNI